MAKVTLNFFDVNNRLSLISRNKKRTGSLVNVAQSSYLQLPRNYTVVSFLFGQVLRWIVDVTVPATSRLVIRQFDDAHLTMARTDGSYRKAIQALPIQIQCELYS